jgi:hypothetical protein
MNSEPDSEAAKEQELQYVDSWDMDTVEFEISMVPWPLRWDAAEKVLTWASTPEYPPEDTEAWTEVLDFVRGEILEKSHTHVQVAQAIHKAFPTDDTLATKGVKVVKRYKLHLPKGWKR